MLGEASEGKVGIPEVPVMKCEFAECDVSVQRITQLSGRSF